MISHILNCDGSPCSWRGSRISCGKWWAASQNSMEPQCFQVDQVYRLWHSYKVHTFETNFMFMYSTLSDLYRLHVLKPMTWIYLCSHRIVRKEKLKLESRGRCIQEWTITIRCNSTSVHSHRDFTHHVDLHVHWCQYLFPLNVTYGSPEKVLKLMPTRVECEDHEYTSF